MNEAAARSGVMPTNQAARVESVVPVLPATGRPTMPYTPGAVDQPPQEPRAAPKPVTQRAASAAARAVAGLTACMQRGLATSTPLYAACEPSGAAIDSTGSGSQYLPSAATVAYALDISSGVASDTPSVNAPQPRAFFGEACSLSMS